MRKLIAFFIIAVLLINTAFAALPTDPGTGLSYTPSQASSFNMQGCAITALGTVNPKAAEAINMGMQIYGFIENPEGAALNMILGQEVYNSGPFSVTAEDLVALFMSPLNAVLKKKLAETAYNIMMDAVKDANPTLAMAIGGCTTLRSKIVPSLGIASKILSDQTTGKNTPSFEGKVTGDGNLGEAWGWDPTKVHIDPGSEMKTENDILDVSSLKKGTANFPIKFAGAENPVDCTVNTVEDGEKMKVDTKTGEMTLSKGKIEFTDSNGINTQIDATDIKIDQNGKISFGSGKIEHGGVIVDGIKKGGVVIDGKAVAFDPKNGELDIGDGSFDLGKNKIENVQNGKFKFRQIPGVTDTDGNPVYETEGADFYSKGCAKEGKPVSCNYALIYGNKQYTLQAGAGGHVEFDPKNSKIKGTGVVLVYGDSEGQTNLAEGDIDVDLDEKGNLKKVRLLKKDSHYRKGDLEAFAPTDEEVSVFFDGNIPDDAKNAISFSADMKTFKVKGKAGAAKYLVGEKNAIVKFRVIGKEGTLAGISIGNIDTFFVTNGELDVQAGLSGFFKAQTFSIKEHGTGTFSDDGKFKAPGFDTVIPDMAVIYELGGGDFNKMKEGIDKFGQLIGAYNKARKGDLSGLEKFNQANPGILQKYFPDAYQSIDMKASQKEFSEKEADIKAKLKSGELTPQQAISMLNSLKKDYPGFSPFISLDLADAYDKIGEPRAVAESKKLRQEFYVYQAGIIKSDLAKKPNDLGKRYDLAAYYVGAGRNDLAEEENKKIIAIADKVISGSKKKEDIDNARSFKAKALNNLQRFDEAINEYQQLAFSPDKTLAIDARLNLAIFKGKGNSDQRLAAVGDFSALEKLAKDQKDEGLELFAHRMARTIGLDLLRENSVKALDGDKKAESIAAMLKQKLKLDKNSIDDTIKGYSDDFSKIYNGNVPEKIQKQIEAYRKELETLSNDPDIFGITRKELAKVEKAAMNLELDKTTTPLNAEFKSLVEKSQSKTRGAVNDLKKEIFKKDKVMQQLDAQASELERQQIDAESKGMANLAESKKLEAIKYRAEIAKRQKAITMGVASTDEYDLDMMAGDAIEKSSERRELMAKQPWYRAIPYAGDLLYYDSDGDGVNDAKQINELKKTIDQTGNDWEKKRIATDVKNGYLSTRFNPKTMQYETLDDTIYVGQEREMLELKKNVETFRDTMFTAASIIGPGAIARAAYGVGATALAESGILSARLLANPVTGTIVKYGGRAIVEGTVFHLTNSIATESFAGIKYTSALAWNNQQDMDIAKQEIDATWENMDNVGDSIQTFLMLGAGGALEKSTIGKIPYLTKTASGATINTMVLNPFVQSVIMTMGTLPDIAQGDLSNPYQTRETIEKTFEDNMKLTMGLNAAHVGTAVKQAKISSLNSELIEKNKGIQNNIKELEIEKSKIAFDEKNTIGGELTDGAAAQLKSLQSRIFEQQKLMLDNTQKIAENSYKAKITSPEEYSLETKKQQYQKALLDYDIKKNDMLSNQKGAESAKNLLISDPSFRQLSKDLVSAKENYVNEFDKQKWKIATKGEVPQDLFDVQGVKKTISTEKADIKYAEKEAKNLEKAKKTQDTAKKNLDESNAEPNLRQAAENSPAQSAEKEKARIVLADNLAKKADSDKVREAAVKYERIEKDYPQGELAGEKGMVPEVAAFKAAESFYKAGEIDKAVSKLENLKKTSQFISPETIDKKISEIKTNPEMKKAVESAQLGKDLESKITKTAFDTPNQASYFSDMIMGIENPSNAPKATIYQKGGKSFKIMFEDGKGNMQIASVDLQNFKDINTKYLHMGGDKVLLEFPALMQERLSSWKGGNPTEFLRDTLTSREFKTTLSNRVGRVEVASEGKEGTFEKIPVSKLNFYSGVSEPFAAERLKTMTSSEKIAELQKYNDHAMDAGKTAQLVDIGKRTDSTAVRSYDETVARQKAELKAKNPALYEGEYDFFKETIYDPAFRPLMDERIRLQSELSKAAAERKQTSELIDRIKNIDKQLAEKTVLDNDLRLNGNDNFKNTINNLLRDNGIKEVSVSRVDINYFSELNSRLGTKTADIVKSKILDIMDEVINSNNRKGKVFVIGGDEIGYISYGDRIDNAQIAKEIISKVNELPYEFEASLNSKGEVSTAGKAYKLKPSISIGTASATPDIVYVAKESYDASSVLNKLADLSAESAKIAGKKVLAKEGKLVPESFYSEKNVVKESDVLDLIDKDSVWTPNKMTDAQYDFIKNYDANARNARLGKPAVEVEVAKPEVKVEVKAPEAVPEIAPEVVEAPKAEVAAPTIDAYVARAEARTPSQAMTLADTAISNLKIEGKSANTVIENANKISDIKAKGLVVEKGVAYLPAEGKAIFVGDTHGELSTVAKIISDSRFIERVDSGENIYLVFTGDYVDRGPKSLENIEALLDLKMRYSDRIVLLKGNHETIEINSGGYDGFLSMVYEKYGKETGKAIHERYNEVFNELPIALVTGNGIVAVHGGVPEGIKSLSDMTKLSETKKKQVLWNDPDPVEKSNALTKLFSKGFRENTQRGTDTEIKYFGQDAVDSFLKNVGGKVLIRAHEVESEGFRTSLNGKVLTVFSADYKGKVKPKFLEVDLSENINGFEGLAPNKPIKGVQLMDIGVEAKKPASVKAAMAAEKTPESVLIKNSKDFNELYNVLDGLGEISGTKEVYRSDEIKGIITRVRNGELRIEMVTRTSGTREIVNNFALAERQALGTLSGGESVLKKVLNNEQLLGIRESHEMGTGALGPKHADGTYQLKEGTYTLSDIKAKDARLSRLGKDGQPLFTKDEIKMLMDYGVVGKKSAVEPITSQEFSKYKNNFNLIFGKSEISLRKQKSLGEYYERFSRENPELLRTIETQQEQVRQLKNQELDLARQIWKQGRTDLIAQRDALAVQVKALVSESDLRMYDSYRIMKNYGADVEAVGEMLAPKEVQAPAPEIQIISTKKTSAQIYEELIPATPEINRVNEIIKIGKDLEQASKNAIIEYKKIMDNPAATFENKEIARNNLMIVAENMKTKITEDNSYLGKGFAPEAYTPNTFLTTETETEFFNGIAVYVGSGRPFGETGSVAELSRNIREIINNRQGKGSSYRDKAAREIAPDLIKQMAAERAKLNPYKDADKIAYINSLETVAMLEINDKVKPPVDKIDTDVENIGETLTKRIAMKQVLSSLQKSMAQLNSPSMQAMSIDQRTDSIISYLKLDDAVRIKLQENLDLLVEKGLITGQDSLALFSSRKVQVTNDLREVIKEALKQEGKLQNLPSENLEDSVYNTYSGVMDLKLITSALQSSSSYNEPNIIYSRDSDFGQFREVLARINARGNAKFSNLEIVYSR